MAKKTTIEIKTGNTDFEITPKTKSAEYVYSDSLTEATNVTFTADKGTYTSYTRIMYKDGDDFVILTKFTKNNVVKKTVTSTLKGYFTNEKAGKIFGEDAIKPLYNKEYPDDYTSAKKNWLYDEVLVGKTYENTAEFNAVIGNTKSNTYNLTKNGGDKIFEEKGNETYNIAHTSVDTTTVYDYVGKDKYNLSKGSKVSITDYSGKDAYTISIASGNIYEMAGNDKYTAVASTGTLTIRDEVGADKYNIENSGSIVVRDNAGADNYTLKDIENTYSDVNIIDSLGNDKYSLSDVKGSDTKEFCVWDYAGKDKYTITGDNGSDTKNLEITDGYVVVDPTKITVSGNDTYNLTNATYTDINDRGGNNKFNLKGSSYINITNDGKCKDKTNNDTYNVSGIAPNKKKGTPASYATGVVINDKSLTSSDTYNFSYYDKGDEVKTVYDEGGSDKYTVKNSVDIIFEDVQSLSSEGTFKNTFNVTNTTNFYINGGGWNASDRCKYKATDDTYNITSSAGSVRDYNKDSDDTYKISKYTLVDGKKGYVTVKDYGGENDTLVVDSKKNNLVFITDGGKTTDLFVYDKKTHVFSVIDSYFGNSMVYTGTGIDDWYTEQEEDDKGKKYIDTSVSRIETIKAGKTNVSSMILSADEMNGLRSDVAGWLTANGCASMTDALKNAETIGDEGAHGMNALIAMFTKQA